MTEPRGEEREALAVALGRCVLRLDGVRERDHDRVGCLHPDERATEPKSAPDAGDELRLGERLRDEVVGAGVEPGDDIRQRGPTRQEQDREGRMTGIESQPTGQLVPVETGQPNVEQDEVGPMDGDRAQASLAIGGGVNAVPLRFKEPGEQRPVRLVILDDQDGRGRQGYHGSGGLRTVVHACRSPLDRPGNGSQVPYIMRRRR